MKSSGGSAARLTNFESETGWRTLSEELKWIEQDRFSSIRQSRIDLIKQGKSLTDLSMINPDTPPPRFCLDKLSEFLLDPANHRYSVARGIKKLRQAFANKYLHRFSVRLNPEENICVTAGTKDALMHVLRVATRPADKVLIPAPTYPLYNSALNFNSLEACYYAIEKDQDQMLSNIHKAIIDNRPQVLLLNFPNNPTGMLVDANFYNRLLTIVKEFDILVINDFVYGELSFDQKNACSLLSIEGFIEQAVEIYSMSKAYNVPGWRIGAVLGYPSIITRISSLKSHTDYGSFLPLQHAASAALSVTTDLVYPQVQLYKDRCRGLESSLNKLGFKVSPAQAGCCVWAELPDSFVSDYGSVLFALECIRKLEVQITPGEIFGEQYSRFIRIAAVRPEEELIRITEKFAALIAH